MKTFKILIGIYLFAFSISSFAQGIDFQLVKIENINACRLFFDVTNKTNLNITGGVGEATLREGDGSIMNKHSFTLNRIKQGATETVDSVSLQPCREVKVISVQINFAFIDGKNSIGNEYINSLVNSGKRSSLVKGVTLK